MSKESKIILLITALVIASIAILVSFVNSSQSDPAAIMKTAAGENSHSVGEGEVQVVEFGDYQCPACAQAYPTTKRIKEEFEGKITFIYRQFPLPGHANAQPSAEAAEAAGEQGKFWEMHDKLFETQAQWSSLADPTTIFVQYAEELELDKEKFADDLTGKVNKERISKDQSDGYEVGVTGTPTFFVNGKKQNAFDYESLKSAIEAELN